VRPVLPHRILRDPHVLQLELRGLLQQQRRGLRAGLTGRPRARRREREEGPIRRSPSEIQPGDRLTLAIDRLAADGEAIATAPDGRVLFVRAAAPGDRVEVEIARVRSRSLHGFVRRRSADGPARVPTFCPDAERCGGCPWQGIDRREQRAALGRHVSRLLGRAAGRPVEVEVEAVEPGKAWRATARIHWKSGRLGFHGARSDEIVDLPVCAVLAPNVQALFTAVRRRLGPALRGAGSLRLTAAPGAGSGTVHLDRSLPDAVLDPLLADPACHGVVAGERRAGRPFNVFGGVSHPAEAFVQAHPAGAAAVARTVLDWVPPGPLLELYAGSGAFTLPLALAGRSVTAVEADAAAARSLAEEAERRGLPVRVIAGSADRPPAGEWPAVLLDPPRTGAAAAVAALALRPALRRVVYVACDPATLARDVGTLARAGWRLADARAFDSFPHTGHVETVVALDRPTGGA
jgi:23S rRNA (uracil1939-C5)-methyltransferase